MSGTALAGGKPQPTPSITGLLGPSQPVSTDKNPVFHWDAVSNTSYTCSLDGGKPVTCTPSTTGPGAGTKLYSNLLDGAHTFVLKAQLAASGGTRYKATSTNWSWTLDTTPPATPTITQLADTRSQFADIYFSSDATATTFDCQLDQVDPNTGNVLATPYAAQSCTSPWHVTGLSSGTYRASVWAFDAVLNKSAAGTMQWLIDATAPETPGISIAQAPLTNLTYIDASFTTNETSTFTCSVDGGAFSSCSNPAHIKGFAEGDHSLTVIATDGFGNTSNAATATWHVDLTAPTLSINSGPAATTNQTSASFMYSVDDSTATLTCNLDGAGFGTCPAPLTYSGLGAGPHTFAMRAVDPASNTTTTPNYNWTVNLSAPGPAYFLSGPDNPTNSTTATFDWDATDPSNTTGYSCQLDRQAWPPAGSTAVCDPTNGPVTVTGLTEGSHVFAVSALNGSAASAMVTYGWNVDLTPPTAPVFSTTPSTTSTTAVFSFASDPGTSFTCSLDGATAGPCATLVTYYGLSTGVQHTFDVWAWDDAGNSSHSSWKWTIDTSAPAPPTVTGPTGYVSTSAATLSWSDTDPSVATSTCAVDTNAPTSPCPATTSTPPLSDGPHSFTVSVSNSNGDVSQTTIQWVVDTVAPVLHVASVPSGLTNQRDVAPSITQDEVNPGPANCSLASGSTTLANTCGPYLGLADGSYTLTVDTTDLAGHPATEVVDSWTIDGTAPVLTVTGVPSGLTNATSVTPSVSQNADEANPGPITCSLTGPVSQGDCGPYSGLADGSYTLTVDTTDLAGNPATEVVDTWTVDHTAPVLNVSGVPSGTVAPQTVTPQISQKDANPGSSTCSLTGPVSQSDCGPYSNLPDGNYTLTVNGTDAAGNPAVTPWSQSWTFATPSTPTTTATPTPPPTQSVPSTPTDTTKPTVTSLTAMRTLTGTSTATFSETVHGLASGGVALYANASTVVPSYVGCLSGTTAVSCGSSFTSLQVRPKSALVPGQYYSVGLAAGAVKDAAGNPLVARSVYFRGSRYEQENSLAAASTWTTVKASSAYGRSLVQENLPGATAAYSFYGPSLTWWTVTGRSQGWAAVYIDGKRKAYVNNYTATTHYRVARKYARLGKRWHTIRVVVLGVKGAKAATGTYVAVDAFTVGTKRTNSPRLLMTWHPVANSHFSGRHAVAANAKGETVSFTFRGTSIAWFTQKARNQGRVAVYVDGVRKAVVDNYARKTGFGVKRLVSRLANKVHTLQLVVLGTHHKGGTGTWLTVDWFSVG